MRQAARCPPPAQCDVPGDGPRLRDGLVHEIVDMLPVVTDGRVARSKVLDLV